jgi:hypothetical protein
VGKRGALSQIGSVLQPPEVKPGGWLSCMLWVTHMKQDQLWIKTSKAGMAIEQVVLLE